MTYDVASSATEVSSAKTGDARGAITVQFVADKAEWDRLIASSPDPHLPQGFAYGEGKAAKGWSIRLVHRINRGPLFLEAKPTASMLSQSH